MTGRLLIEKHPQLAAQWHPTRNAWPPPADVLAGSSRVVWWRCPNGHEWEERVAQRSNVAPQWKRGDPAACRQCLSDDERADGTQVTRWFACGHERRVTMRNLRRYGIDECADCRLERQAAELNAPAAVSARRKAYRAKVAALGPRPKLTPPQHSAQRRIVGILRASGAVYPAEIIIQRPYVAFADETSAEDVAALLAVLDVATTVDEKSERAPGRRRDGDRYARVHIARSEWPRMVEVFPSLADVLDGL